MINYSSDDIIKALNLIPLPEEGGFYRETFRSKRLVHSSDLKKDMSECTAIYYLVTQDSFSALHLVDMDEIFHFYAGSPVEMLQITESGASQLVTLGSNVMAGEVPQLVVPHGVWQGTRLKGDNPAAWALMGCTVAPGFEYDHFHIKSRTELNKLFPHLIEEIQRFTHF